MQRWLTQARYVAVVAVLLALPACGGGSYTLQEVAVEPDIVWVAVLRTDRTTGGWLIGACPRLGDRLGRRCTWSEVQVPPDRLTPANVDGAPEGQNAVLEASAAAARDHGCPRVEVRSTHDEGDATAFWLRVCGRDRFYRLSGEPRRYVEATPTE